MEENGEGFSIGSASINSVFTAFLTPIAVIPVTQSVASHPPTEHHKINQSQLKSWNWNKQLGPIWINFSIDPCRKRK